MRAEGVAGGPTPAEGEAVAGGGVGAGKGELDENFVRLYWQQMLLVGRVWTRLHALLPALTGFCWARSSPLMAAFLVQAVQSIHEKRIVHSDLKPANFMLVQGQVGDAAWPHRTS